MLRLFAASLIASGGEYALFLVSSFLAFSAPHQQTACGLGHYCYEVEEWELKKKKRRWSSYFMEGTNASFLFFIGAMSYMTGLWS